MKELANPSDRARQALQLRAAWEELKAAHHHLHSPQAAAMLGVPEGALTACRVGDGATRLAAEPFALLAPIRQWRRVLIAHSSAAGVNLLIGEIADIAQTGDCIRLTGAHIDTAFSAVSVADAFWFIEQDDAHGRTRSLQFFDAEGRDVLKVLIMHRTAATGAAAHFAPFTHPDQTPGGEFTGILPADRFSPDRSVAGLAEPLAANPSELFAATITALPQAGEAVRFTTYGDSAQQTAIGCVSHVRRDERMVHIHEQDIRMHLRPGGVDGAWAERTGGAVSALIFTTQGRKAAELRLAADLTPAARASWGCWAENLFATGAL